MVKNNLLDDIRTFSGYEDSGMSIFESDLVKSGITASECHFIKLNEIGFDGEIPGRESLENVISVLNEAFVKVVYFLSSQGGVLSVYLGVIKDNNSKSESKFHASDFGEILKESFCGNFHGSDIEDITTKKSLTKEIEKKFKSYKGGSVITGIPSVISASDNDKAYSQSLDVIVNSMSSSHGDWGVLTISEALSTTEIKEIRDGLYRIYDQLHEDSKATVQKSSSSNYGTTDNKTIGTSNGSNNGKGTSNSRQTGESKGKSDSTTLSKETVNKSAIDLIEYMDSEVFERISDGLTRGLFNTTTYALAENRLTHHRLARNLCSVWQGDSSSRNPLRVTEINKSLEAVLPEILAGFNTLNVSSNTGEALPVLFGNSVSGNKVQLATRLTAKELSLIFSLPRKEIPGIQLRKSTDFGLNPKRIIEKDAINLGEVLTQGADEGNIPLMLDKNMLSRHVFIAGVTGGGKTTTCHRLLKESDLPFIVIEPAKTEYRPLLGEIDDLEIYTLGNESVSPFRFNPFELLKGESLTSHVDMLKAAFTAAYPMEAAMPYLLEEAIYESYKEFGWNLNGWDDIQEANIYTPDPWEENGRYWPTLNDMLRNMSKVVKAKGFDTRLESDYNASLVARFKNLTMGAKGKMLNCKVSTSIERLLDQRVILELDELKSSEDKCLMMGLVITRLSEAIKLRWQINPEYKHITLIEEAHRLLEKPSPTDGGAKAHAVTMFCDLLAEVRKYGESLIIVDQIPNKLAPDVLKNTNTKIVHKLFARDDREAIGDTIGLDDQQKEFLTQLRIGEVVMYSGSWNRAVHGKISYDSSSKELSGFELNKQVSEKSEKMLIANCSEYYPELSGEENSDFISSYKVFIRKYERIFSSAIGAALEIPKETARSGPDRPMASNERFNCFKDKFSDISSCLPIDSCLLDSFTNRMKMKLSVSVSEQDVKEYLEAKAKLVTSESYDQVINLLERDEDLFKDLLSDFVEL